MKEDKYGELIEGDAISAILMFQEMSVPNRIKAVLYVLDNLDVNHPNYKLVLTDNFKELLKLIRQENKNWTDGGDDKLIEDVAEIWYQKYPEERPVEEIPVEEIPVEEEEIKVKNFYRLLT